MITLDKIDIPFLEMKKKKREKESRIKVFVQEPIREFYLGGDFGWCDNRELWHSEWGFAVAFR
jgi:hypothetical protein